MRKRQNFKFSLLRVCDSSWDVKNQWCLASLTLNLDGKYLWMHCSFKNVCICVHVPTDFEMITDKGYWLELFFSYARLWGLNTSQHDLCFSKRSRVELHTVFLLWSTYLISAVSWPSVRKDWLRQTLKHICWSCAKALFIKTMWK